MSALGLHLVVEVTGLNTEPPARSLGLDDEATINSAFHLCYCHYKLLTASGSALITT